MRLPTLDRDSQVDDKVLSLVNHIWTEAQGDLENLCSVPIDSFNQSNLDQAESILLSIKNVLKSKSRDIFDLADLEDKFYELIPHKTRQDINTLSVVHRKIDFCQLIRDVVSVSEATNWTKSSGTRAKYKTLGCSIKCIPSNSSEWNSIAERFLSSQVDEQSIVVHEIYEVCRPVEEEAFTSSIDNKKFLFHSSQAKNFVGIFSRGLLLPKIVVDDFGGTRTDPGMLGSGIYFASSAR